MTPAYRKILESLSGRNLMRAGKTGYTAMCAAHEDIKNSLSVDETKEGKILVHCFAGCEPEAICEAHGWKMTDLFPRPARSELKIVATYDYNNEDGELLSQVVRLEPKSFRQRRPTPGEGTGWTWSLGDVRRVLYRLPEMKEKRKQPLWIVEGEKDADALAALGFRVTTTLGGASAWREEYVDSIKACKVAGVYVIPDNDAPGRKYAHAIASSLHAAGIPVKVVNLPGVPEKGDVSDFLKTAQYPKGDLVRLAQGASRFMGDEEEPTAPRRGWRTGPELDDSEPTWLVQGLIPKGTLGSISGRDGRGKSLLGLEIVKAVLTGEPLLGLFPVVETGAVCMIVLDENENLVRKRLRLLGILEHPNLLIRTRRDVHGDPRWEDRTSYIDALTEDISQLKVKVVFVLIDAMYLFIPESGKSGQDQANSSGAMLPIMEAFDRMAQSGPTVGVVMHNNKADSDIQGSQSIRNMLKWVLMLVLPKKYSKDLNAGRVTPDRILQLGKIKDGAGANEWGFRLRGDAEGRVFWDAVELIDLERRDKKKDKAERRQKMVDWIQFFLEPGARTSTEVYAAGWEAGKYTKRELEVPDFADAAGIEKSHPSPDAPWFWRLRGNA